MSGLLIVFSGLSAVAQTMLSGDVGNRTFEASGSPYVVEDAIVIPEEKETVIKAGCVFQFREFTGCKVSGSLRVEGTSENPVVFTSANDREGAIDNPPAAFDWNGIEVTPKATGVTLVNFALKYSVYGIKSGKTEMIIKNGIFSQNGQYNFTINGDIQPVVEAVPYSYQAERLVADKPAEGKPRVRRPYHLAIPIASGAVTLGAGGAAIYFLTESLKWHEKYLDAEDDFDDYIDEEEKAGNYAIACTGVAVTTLAVGVVTFLLMPPKSIGEEPKLSFISSVAPDYVSAGIRCPLRLSWGRGE